MRYYANEDTGTVITLEDSEPLSVLPHGGEGWVEVHIHHGPGGHHKASKAQRVVSVALFSIFVLSITSLVVATSVWLWTAALS